MLLCYVEDREVCVSGDEGCYEEELWMLGSDVFLDFVVVCMLP